MDDVWQVTAVTPTRELAASLARSAVSERLAAGGYINGPVSSVFWHAGEFGTGEEWQVVLKSTSEKYNKLQQHLLENHVWDNPEITAVPVVAGTAAYLEWVRRTTA